MKLKDKTNNYSELKNPIIFIGSGRSGTTIISEIIMRHPVVAFPSNYHSKFYRLSLISQIRKLFDNKYWVYLGQKRQLNKVSWLNKFAFKPSEAYSMWDYLTGARVDFSRDFLVNQQATPEQVKFIRNYFYKLVRYQNKSRLALKITGPSRIAYLLSIFPDARFVNLTRSKIPVINSLLKVKFWKTRGYNKLWWIGAYNQDEIEWARKNEDDPIALTAFQVKKLEEVTEYERQKYDPKILDVTYEHFVSSPEKEIHRIIEFLDLRTGATQCLDYLNKIQIYNRNKTDNEYFNSRELHRISQIFDYNV